MLKDFKYEFINELEYDYSGGNSIAESIEVTAPNNKLRIHTTAIECAYLSASEAQQHKLMACMPEEKVISLMNSAKSMEDAEQEAKDLEKNQTASQIVNTMMANSDAKKMNAVYGALEMILKDSAMLDGRTKFGSAIFPKMSLEDTKNLLGEYIKSFFIVSPQV